MIPWASRDFSSSSSCNLSGIDTGRDLCIETGVASSLRTNHRPENTVDDDWKFCFQLLYVDLFGHSGHKRVDRCYRCWWYQSNGQRVGIDALHGRVILVVQLR